MSEPERRPRRALTRAADRPRRALTRAADRLLQAAAWGLSLLGALLLWYGVQRRSAPIDLAYGLVLCALGGVCAAGPVFRLLRARIYAKLPAPRLLVLGASLSLPLLALELWANLSNPQGYLYFANTQRYFAWQRYEGVLPSHQHPPSAEVRVSWGTIRTNSQGWRSPEVSAEPAPGTLRVLALGDSVVFGWGVPREESYCAAIERALAKELPPGYRAAEVINTGNGSCDSLDELMVLKGGALALRPQVAFCLVIDNDFERPPYRDQVEALRGLDPRSPRLLEVLSPRAIERPRLPGPRAGAARELFLGVSYWVNRSFLVSTLGHGMRHLGGRGGGAESQPGSGSGALATRRLEALPPVDLEALRGRLPYLDEQVECLREMGRSCAAQGVRLAFLVYDPRSAEQTLWRHLAQELGLWGPVEPLLFPEGGLPAMAELVNSATDTHWNAAGSEHYARLTVAALKRALARPARKK